MHGPTFVDLFCGAGGLSLGLKEAGWKPLLAVDHWPDAAATYAANFPGERVISEDVSTLDEKRLRNLVSQPPDWVVGGPPCQGFSTVGRREPSDPRNKLVREFARVVQILRPKGFLVENVLGLRDMRFIGHVCGLFFDLGYEVTPLLLTAADYGVPQLRRRVVFVGHSQGRSFLKPKPVKKVDEYVTVWDAIGDLPELQPGQKVDAYDRVPFTKYQRRMRQGSRSLQGHEASDHPAYLVRAISFIPDGGNRLSIPSPYQPKSGYHNSYSRLHSRSPAVAVTQNMGKPSATRCIHPFQNRGLTAREGARLQGFCDTFHFLGPMCSQRLQIANAVPPILGAVLGQALRDPDHWIDRPVAESQYLLFRDGDSDRFSAA
ncbi:MAG TPA: DNA cytosine methyltransferase [Gemmataceae bacterium]|nr:DNA cytosine methyltransferase [Gemmataceae bacterium]